MVHEDAVTDLNSGLRDVERRHSTLMRVEPREFHGNELWQGTKNWSSLTAPDRLAAYEDAISLLRDLDLSVAHASIHKAHLETRWGEGAARSAYLLALQFLLEKIDLLWGEKKILVADEAKEHELRAVRMVSDLQQWGRGEVAGIQLTHTIDTIHFVNSRVSPGVQMADLVAYLLQRGQRGTEAHPDAQAGRDRMIGTIWEKTVTWREAWPRTP